MALRDLISKWHEAMCLLNEKAYTEAASKLLEINKPSAKIIYNIGCINVLQKLYADAVEFFNSSIEQDKYLAIAYYLRGVCYHELQRNDRAELDFLTAQSMTKREGIDYTQLGAQIILGPELMEECLTLTRDAYHRKERSNLPLVSVMDCIFQPPKKMVDNLVKQNFLGKSKVISSTAQQDITNAMTKGPHAEKPSSLPASPAVSHYRKTANNGGKMPPPPSRPPPRLIPGVGACQEIRPKSKSMENLTADIPIYEDIDDFLPSDTSRPVPPHVSAKPVSKIGNSKLSSSQTSVAFSQSCINSQKAFLSHSGCQGSLDTLNQLGIGKSYTNMDLVPGTAALEGTSLQTGYVKNEDDNSKIKSPFKKMTTFDHTSQAQAGQGESKTNGRIMIGSLVKPRNCLLSSSSAERDYKNVNQGQGHAARMKSLFESKEPQSLGKQDHQSIRLTKSPKPVRPPPPKLPDASPRHAAL